MISLPSRVFAESRAIRTSTSGAADARCAWPSWCDCSADPRRMSRVIEISASAISRIADPASHGSSDGLTYLVYVPFPAWCFSSQGEHRQTGGDERIGLRAATICG